MPKWLQVVLCVALIGGILQGVITRYDGETLREEPSYRVEGNGGILYTLRNGVPSFNHYNARGDVVAKTDGSGNLTYQAEYQAFGTRPLEVGSTLDRERANTKQEDPTGLKNEGIRYVDQDTGTFITKDPTAFALAMGDDYWIINGREVDSQATTPEMALRQARAFTQDAANSSYTTPDSTAKATTGSQSRQVSRVQNESDRADAPKERIHIVGMEAPNWYAYVNDNPWSAFDPEGLDAVLLNDKNAAALHGHAAVIVGNDQAGWTFYSKNGGSGTSGNTKQNFSNLGDFAKSDASKRFDGADRVPTTPAQDDAMKAYGDANYNKPYCVAAKPDASGDANTAENCADLAAGILNAGGVHTDTPKTPTPWGEATDPDKQLNEFQQEHGNSGGDKPPSTPPPKPTTASNSNNSN